MKGNESAEVRIMERKLPKERFFPEYYDSRVSSTSSMIVLEYCEAGDLAIVNYSQTDARNQLPDAFVWHFFLSLGNAIASCAAEWRGSSRHQARECPPQIFKYR